MAAENKGNDIQFSKLQQLIFEDEDRQVALTRPHIEENARRVAIRNKMKERVIDSSSENDISDFILNEMSFKLSTLNKITNIDELRKHYLLKRLDLMVERKYGHYDIPHAVVLSNNNTNNKTKKNTNNSHINTSIGKAIGTHMVSSRGRSQSNNKNSSRKRPQFNKNGNN